jgi:hypothetical protein
MSLLMKPARLPRQLEIQAASRKKSRGDTIRTCDLYVPNVAL